MKFNKINLLLTCCLAAFTAHVSAESTAKSADKSKAQVTEQNKGRPLRDIVADKYPTNVYIGGTIQYNELDGPKGDLLNKEFRYITPANIYKQSHIHPKPNQWRWEKPDAWIATAKENGQLVRIHGPISPQSSKWALADHRTHTEMLDMLTDYMTALSKRYNGHESVKWLDVVNEAITEEGTWFGPKPGVDKWENPWTILGFETNIPDQFPLLQKLGVPYYILESFAIAKRNAPDLKLILNQHRMTTLESIALMKELVIYLRYRGLRIDGIGWQAHMRNEYVEFADRNHQRLKTLDELVKWAHSNNLEFHVTETNIHLKNEVPYEEQLVADAFTNILEVLLNNRDTGVVGWSVWTIADVPHFKDKTIKTLGIWSDDLVPHKAYYQVQKLLEESASK
ncbi:endo-1,4-beta-xylanase [Thalassomonas sp. M1454]|uniref:endo-1,4-beta-xylanase n=1 Tax=Thalassomonas sp. M1454 TaxID=2594477 RepID=UPI00117FE019|nr:endo-1,4-beta-xylanase [Thalassomonas sp. M1454]TRX53936.1 endo-1,4-beta-xylanase [Thalassomonas sp. M1454]